MTIDDKLDLLQEQITCGKPVYTWHYDAGQQLLKSNCPYESTLAMAFSIFGCKERMFSHGRENGRPLVLGAPIGLVWAACFEREGDELPRAKIFPGKGTGTRFGSLNRG